MSGLAALLAGHNPPAVYQWHSNAHAADVQHAVEHAGWDFRYLDGWTVEDRESFLKAATAALDLPDGQAPDGDLTDHLASALGTVSVNDHGMVLLWDGWSPLCRQDQDCFDQVLAGLRRRAEAGDAGKFAVILRGDGPDLPLEELPIRH